MSDFGADDHYVAAVKGKIFAREPEQRIVDITHSIRPFDISHGATVLASVFRDFPKGTVHLVSVDAAKELSPGIAIELEGHYFIGFDCGLFSMISKEKPALIVQLKEIKSTFPARDLLADLAVDLAKGKTLSELGSPVDQIKELFSRQLKVTKREIVGNVVNVDHYGNLISNITQEEFETIRGINGSAVRFVIRFGRESFDQLHEYFADVDSGECFVLFNSIGQLQIGINKGDASQLLGLSIDAPIHIEFVTN